LLPLVLRQYGIGVGDDKLVRYIDASSRLFDLGIEYFIEKDWILKHFTSAISIMI
jgi:hypothetical protein